MMPLTYKHGYHRFNFTALVSIYYSDGTVAVSHGGVDMGQGMNTKVSSNFWSQRGVDISATPIFGRALFSLDVINPFKTLDAGR